MKECGGGTGWQACKARQKRIARSQVGFTKIIVRRGQQGTPRLGISNRSTFYVFWWLRGINATRFVVAISKLWRNLSLGAVTSFGNHSAFGLSADPTQG